MLLEALSKSSILFASTASTRLRSSARLEKLGSLLRAPVVSILALESVGKLLVCTHKPAKKDKYGRYVAEVMYVNASGETMSLNEQLVARGFATSYVT